MKIMYRIIQVICCVLFITILVGCGFTLKTTRPLPFDEVNLELSGCPQFKRALSAYLRSNKITIFEDKAPSRPTLKIQCPHLETIPLVYDGEGQLRRQRLIYTLNASFSNEQTHSIHTSVVREQQLNSNQSLGDAAERAILIDEMQKSIFYKLIMQLSAHNNHAN